MAGEELAGVLIGAFLIALGCASLLVSTLRSGRPTRILLSFGLSAGLYGLRVLALQAPVRATIGDAFPWRYFIVFVTYLINVPLTDFIEGIIGLLYSDGVLEARDRAGQFFDGERVARWMSDIEHRSAERFAEAALQELTQWTGSGFEDDVTFVIAARRDSNRA